MPPVETPIAPAAPASAPPTAPEPGPAPSPSPEPSPAAAEERFVDIDEADLASLPPEVRKGVVDPLLTKFNSKAKEKFLKEREGLKGFQQKADVFDKLVQQPWFQQAYYQLQNPQKPQAVQPQAPQPVPGIQPQEWNHAYERAAEGDMTALNTLQEKQLDLLVKQKYAPIIEQVQTQQKELAMTMELNDMFSNHEDAKELDSIRVNPADPRSPSLLEMALHFVSDKGGRPFEEAYQAAKRMADQLRTQAKSAAIGIVQDKRASVTEAPARTQVTDEGIVYVDTPQEALRSQITATLKNQNVTYRVRPRQK